MMNKEKLQRFNTLLTGTISGILLPVMVYFLLYYAKIQDIRFTLFSHHLIIGNIIPVILSHCILPNLVLFFIYNGLDWLKAAKGVLITTVILTVFIFAIKLIYSFL
jgi:hypothetical protein